MAIIEKFTAFLGKPVSSLMDMEMEGSLGLAAKIGALVSQEPELAKVFVNAIDLILDGKIDPRIFDDLVAYASFRMAQTAE